MKGRTISLQLESSSYHLSPSDSLAKPHSQPWKDSPTALQFLWKTSVPRLLSASATPFKASRKTLDFLMETQKYISGICKPVHLFRFKRAKLNLEFHTLGRPSELPPPSPFKRPQRSRKRTVLVKKGTRSRLVLVPTLINFSPFDSPKSQARTTVSTPSRPARVLPRRPNTCNVTTLSLEPCAGSEDYVVNSYALPQGLQRPALVQSRQSSPRKWENRSISAYLRRFEQQTTESDIRIETSWKPRSKRPFSSGI